VVGLRLEGSLVTIIINFIITLAERRGQTYYSGHKSVFALAA